jgi:hypothetical protein
MITQSSLYAQQWSVSPATTQPPGGGIYNPSNLDLYNNLRTGYVGVGVVRPRAKLHIHECTYNQFVSAGAAGAVNGLVAQFGTVRGELTTLTNQLNADYKLIVPATPDQGTLLYAFASRVDSLRGAYEHYYQTVQAVRLPPGSESQVNACVGSASACVNTQTTLEAKIQALKPTVDTLPGIQSYLTTLTSYITAGQHLRTVGNQLIQVIFANSNLTRTGACGSAPITGLYPTSNVQLLMTNAQSPRIYGPNLPGGGGANNNPIATQGLLLGLASDVGYVFNQIGTGMYFLTQGGTQPAIAIDRVAGEGRVGINVTDPLATLDVRGTSFRLGPNGASALTIRHTTVTGAPGIEFNAAQAGYAFFNTPSLGVSSRILIGPSAETGATFNDARLAIHVPTVTAGNYFIDCGDNSGSRFHVRESGDSYFAGTSRINGRLGVGITSATPSARLHVQFGAADVANPSDAGTGVILNRTNTTGPAMRNRISFRFNNAETWAMGVDPDNTGEQQFFIASQGNANPGPVVRIHSWGGVGIGATTAQLNTAVTQGTKLFVNGDARVDGLLCAKDLRVRLAGGPCWPDYVFDPDYKLRTLAELRTYIETHRRLPGLEPAEAVEANGFEVGQLNRQLLEKVEELTLYILQLEQRLQAVETR